MAKWLAPWEDFFKDFYEEMKEAFDESFERSLAHLRRPFIKMRFPAYDLADKGDSFILTAEIPGIEKEDLHVSISEDKITIKGEVKRSIEAESKNFYRSERFYGNFSRTIPLPESIDIKKAKASYKNGILTLILPKIKPSEEKEFEIEIE